MNKITITAACSALMISFGIFSPAIAQTDAPILVEYSGGMFPSGNYPALRSIDLQVMKKQHIVAEVEQAFLPLYQWRNEVRSLSEMAEVHAEAEYGNCRMISAHPENCRFQVKPVKLPKMPRINIKSDWFAGEDYRLYGYHVARHLHFGSGLRPEGWREAIAQAKALSTDLDRATFADGYVDSHLVYRPHFAKDGTALPSGATMPAPWGKIPFDFFKACGVCLETALAKVIFLEEAGVDPNKLFLATLPPKRPGGEPHVIAGYSEDGQRVTAFLDMVNQDRERGGHAIPVDSEDPIDQDIGADVRAVAWIGNINGEQLPRPVTMRSTTKIVQAGETPSKADKRRGYFLASKPKRDGAPDGSAFTVFTPVGVALAKATVPVQIAKGRNPVVYEATLDDTAGGTSE